MKNTVVRRRGAAASAAIPRDYGQLLADIRERVRSAQLEALRSVNKELVGLYWDIGRMIVELKMDASHGDAVTEQLAADLRAEFPGMAGFSRRNVFYMREFYVAYKAIPKVQPLVAQIGWTHNLIILTRCSDPLEREFYIRMTRKFGWSKNVLSHQIDNRSYEAQRPVAFPAGNRQAVGGDEVMAVAHEPERELARPRPSGCSGGQVLHACGC